MNPEELFCLNPACPAKGQVGEGNISVHSEQEGRCRCNVCGDTFSCRKGTIFYGGFCRSPRKGIFQILYSSSAH